MNLRTVRTILCKELVETLRDKRTLIAMIGIPILLYPLLIVVVTQVALLQHSELGQMESRVAIAGDADQTVRKWIESMPKMRVIESADPHADLLAGELDAVVLALNDTPAALAGKASAKIRVEYDATEMASHEAMDRIRKGLKKEADRLLAERLKTRGLADEFARPLAVKQVNVAPPEKTTGSILGRILPMLMIVMLGVGAFYPAIDLTAGEKERGTFETLLSTPTSKVEIVCGKFLAIFVLSLITGLLNLGSMTVSLMFQLSQASSQLSGGAGGFSIGQIQISASSVAIIFLTLIPLAFFICSMMMSIALLARNFKEAQNLVTPFYIVIMLPGIVAALPGVELSPRTLFIPIANVSLLFKDLLIGKSSLETVFAVIFTTAMYAVLSLVVAVWLFQREEVILAEEKGLPVTLRRGAFTPRKTPTAGMALMLFALVVLLVLYIGAYVQAREQGREIISGLVITQWCVILLPVVLILWYVRVNLTEGLNLRKPSPAALLATVLMAAGTAILVTQTSVWQSRVLPMPPELKELTKKLFQHDDGTPRSFPVLLFAIAVSPAICEEVLFRGAILSGLRTRLSGAMSVVVVGLLFGLFHLSVHKVVPTGLLGVAIAYVVLRSGSIYAGMLYHFLHNGLIVLAQTERLPAPVLAYLEAAQIEQNGFPAWLLATALAVLVAGIVLMETAGRPKPPAAGGVRR